LKDGDDRAVTPPSVDTSQTTSILSEIVSLPGPALFSGIVQISDTIPSLDNTSEAKLEENFRKQGAMGLILQGDGMNSLSVMVELDSAGAAILLKTLTERVTDSAGDVLSRLRQAINEKRTWNAEILSTVFQGSKYFVVDSLEAIAV
jgi:hypothetical protein